MKKKQNVKALPERNIYYETIVVVGNLVGAYLSFSQIFFTSCCGCCSQQLISAPILSRTALGQWELPQKGVSSSYHPNSTWPGAMTVCCRGTKALLCTDCCAIDASEFLGGIRLRLDFIWKHILTELFLLCSAFFTPLLVFPGCVLLINSLNKNSHFILCFLGNWPMTKIKKVCIDTQINNSTNKSKIIYRGGYQNKYVKHTQPHQ